MGRIDFFYWYWSSADAYNRPSWIWLVGNGLFGALPPKLVQQAHAGHRHMPSTRYSGSKQVPDLFTIDDRSWEIFVAYTQRHLTLDELGRTYGLPAHQVRRIVRQVESEVGRTGPQEHGPLEMESAVEDLGLPVRTLNVLRASGCKTIGDVLRLDLSAPVRGFGARSKKMLVEKLSSEGFSHPAAEEQPVSEIRWLERRLERIQRRVDLALGAVTKEISAAKRRLHRR
jgi:hypothetical protein